MGRPIGRNGAVAILASAFLLSGLFVGVSYGGGGGITEPQVIELVTIGYAGQSVGGVLDVGFDGAHGASWVSLRVATAQFARPERSVTRGRGRLNAPPALEPRSPVRRVPRALR